MHLQKSQFFSFKSQLKDHLLVRQCALIPTRTYQRRAAHGSMALLWSYFDLQRLRFYYKWNRDRAELAQPGILPLLVNWICLMWLEGYSYKSISVRINTNSALQKGPVAWGLFEREESRLLLPPSLASGACLLMITLGPEAQGCEAPSDYLNFRQSFWFLLFFLLKFLWGRDSANL